jgi:protease-4
MLEADSIVSSRQMRRSLGLWRVAAIIAAAAAILVLSLWGSGAGSGISNFSNHIARIRIEGLITGDQRTLDLLEELRKTERVKAVIVHIDSPGGTTAGSEAIYEALRKISEKKPVVSVMGTVAASGGYITAIASDHIVARGNTITGSIGVIFQWAEVSELLKTLGVKMETIKSSELKAEPNMFKPLTEKARQATELLINDSYKWFVGLVAERRQFSDEVALKLADGRVYSGRQAVENKLVDALGGEDQAKNWLVDERKIDKSLKIVDWKRKKDLDPSDFGVSLLSYLFRLVGLESAGQILTNTREADRLKLDGLVSVWHPALH